MKNERTSKRVAKIAAKVLAATYIDAAWCRTSPLTSAADRGFHLEAADIRAMAASCLTQAPDKKPAAKKTKRARPVIIFPVPQRKECELWALSRSRRVHL